MRISRVKIVFVAVCLILFIGIYMSLLKSSEANSWQNARNVVPEKLLQRVVEENAYPGFQVNKEQIRVLKIQHPGQSAPLYLIDFRASDFSESPQLNLLCGASECAFFGYTQQDNDYQKVLAVYLDPHLPPNVSLFQSTNELKNHLPVLSVNQLEGTHIRQLMLSFNERKYEVTETQLLSQSYD